ncbi:MAG: (d)CMP kinase [Candidatus Omnitrophica bacterium]|nr:(d)CMP kinase [Candidatus Omnitrophota bacterium]
MIIAIDGPAGAGKTTIAKLLAKRLGILYLDTGATYRVLTLKALKENIPLDDALALRDTAINLNVRWEEGKIYLDGEDVTDQIRSPNIDKSISLPVSFKEVREAMVEFQRRLVGTNDAVVEGRDTTTVVFPNADYKFYLDASLDERARRRHSEMINKNIRVELEEIKHHIAIRDRADLTRDVGPLKRAPDAILIDTTNLTIEEVIGRILSYIKR